MFSTPTTSSAATTSLPAQSAAAKSPSYAQAQSAGTRAANAARSKVSTILTSSSGVTNFAQTQKKTLLGQ
jgi:hypothetical protein